MIVGVRNKAVVSSGDRGDRFLILCDQYNSFVQVESVRY
jgi:hypothetical protein